jgi:hypothetical protein
MRKLLIEVLEINYSKSWFKHFFLRHLVRVVHMLYLNTKIVIDNEMSEIGKMADIIQTATQRFPLLPTHFNVH